MRVIVNFRHSDTYVIAFSHWNTGVVHAMTYVSVVTDAAGCYSTCRTLGFGEAIDARVLAGEFFVAADAERHVGTVKSCNESSAKTKAS